MRKFVFVADDGKRVIIREKSYVLAQKKLTALKLTVPMDFRTMLK